MDTMSAFLKAEKARKNGSSQKVFDWHKAAQLIKDRKPFTVSAGLSQDWEYTGGEIFRNGKPVPAEDTYVYLSSNWATPQILIDGEIIDCYKMQDEVKNWNAKTYWPDSALAILKEQENDKST